jgi:UDP-GlcNAc:undecaprenyl-phosphate GlcNAc-1-phosphate transferase
MAGVIHLLFPLAISAGISAGLCYCLARWSVRLRLVAQPRPDRWHQTPTPNTGGLGVLIACASAYQLFADSDFRALAAGAAFISMVGFIDDRLQLRPLTKLAGQLAAAILLIAGGASLHLTPWIWMDAIITVFWLVAITNAFNLIDNMDGLCGGVAAIVAVGGACLAILQGDPGRGLLFAVLAGACIGFLIFNHKPARIFLGDCGSLFLGFSLASLALSRPGAATGHSPIDSLYLIPAFLYPIFDMTLVSVLRTRAGKPVSTGGRDHSSHRLVSMGLKERSAVWVLWLCAALCATCPPLTYGNPPWFSAVTVLLLVGLTLLGFTLASLSAFAVPGAAQGQPGNSSAP